MKRTVIATIVILAGFFFTIHALQEQKANGPEPVEKKERPAPVLSVDNSPISQELNGRISSYADVLDDVTSGVVSVFSTRRVRTNPNNQFNHPFFNDPMMRRFFGIPDEMPENEGRGGGREERRPLGLGSGVIVTQDGYILTNNHVIEGADEIKVRLTDGREFVASLIGADEKTDVAVIHIEAEGLPALRFADSDQLRVGDVVFAVGHPLQVGLTVTMGIVSATGRSGLGIIRSEGAYEDFIQTDASINPGNSGGPLVDAAGRVIGINTAILSRSGGNIGIGFAIPSNMARRVMESLISHGSVPRGFLGIRMNEVSQEMAQAFGLPNNRGALVEQVFEGLPAAEAGIVHGDFIVRVNDRRIQSPSELRSVISQIAPGSEVAITVIRKGEEKTFTVVLGDADTQAPVAAELGVVSEGILQGVTLSPLSETLRKQYNVPSEVKGLVVTGVSRESPYARVLREGMVIREWNQVPVESLEQVAEIRRKGHNVLWVFFNGSTGFVTVRIQD